MNMIYRIVEWKSTQVERRRDSQRIGIPSEAEAKACAKAKDAKISKLLISRGGAEYE